MRKGIPPKMSETQGFQYPGHSNWTICSLLSWFCPKMFPSICLSYWGVQLYITPERGAGNEKRDSSNSEKDTGQYLGHSNRTVCIACGADFVPWNFHLPDLYTGGSQFLLPQREEERKEQGLKLGKGNSPKVNETQGFLTLGQSNWTICSLLN